MQRTPRDGIHGEIRRPIFKAAEVAGPDDGGMGEPGEGACLFLEPPGILGPHFHAGPNQELERHTFVVNEVATQVNDAHSPTPKLAPHLIAAGEDGARLVRARFAGCLALLTHESNRMIRDSVGGRSRAKRRRQPRSSGILRGRHTAPLQRACNSRMFPHGGRSIGWGGVHPAWRGVRMSSPFGVTQRQPTAPLGRPLSKARHVTLRAIKRKT